MVWGWVNLKQIFIFGQTIPLFFLATHYVLEQIKLI